jgi:dTDP-4-dehydrorhamnose reductase
MLGKELVLKYPDSIQVDIHNCDISNYDDLLKLNSYDITTIINCAAYTNVDASEDNPEDLYKSNITGVENLVRFANYKSAKLIHFSTDYVFDGLSVIPYTEDNYTCPINKYGLSKSLGEVNIQTKCSDYLILRISWLFGRHGSNFINFVINKLKNNKKFSLLDNYFGTPTYTWTIANHLPFDEQGIIHFTNNYNLDYEYGIEKLSWYEYGKIIAKIGEWDEDLIKPIQHIDRPAKRPINSILNIDKLLSIKSVEHWYDHLKRIIIQKKQIIY